jgi:hypothetical protein
MSSKTEQADLILKLYELRREETMRKARDWYLMQFNPKSTADIMNEIMGPNSGYMRMVATYWDMAAALVNHGAIDIELFNDTNGEHLTVFGKYEPYLAELREIMGPRFLFNLEKLVDTTPGARERVGQIRERLARMFSSRQQQAQAATNE